MKLKSIWPILSSFLFVGVVIYYFVAMSPMMADNFVFSREIHPSFAYFYSGEKITAAPLSVEAAFRQAAEMYGSWCGRFTGNLTVYLLFLLPTWLYHIVAALGFVGYVLLVEMCVFGRQWRRKLSPAWILGIAAMIWTAVPSFGEAFLWLSVGGQIALLGQAAIFLPFRFALDDKSEPATQSFAGVVLKCVLALVLGAAVASLDYPTSAALPPTAVLCVLWLYYRDKKILRKLRLAPLCAAIGLCVGAAFTLGAPGNAARMRLSHDPLVHAYLDSSWVDRVLSWLAHLPWAIFIQIVPLILLGWACRVLYLRYGRSWPRHIPAACLLFLIPMVFTHCAYLFTAWPPSRAFATTSMQLVIGALILFANVEEFASHSEWRQFQILRLALGVFCVVTLLIEGHKFFQFHEIMTERENILSSSAGATAAIPMPPADGADRYWVLGGNLRDIGQDPEYWVNRAMAAHYGAEKVIPVQVEAANYQPQDPQSVHDFTKLSLDRDRLHVALQARFGAPRQLYFYYYGKPALLSSFPSFVARRIFAWLKVGGTDSWRNYLVPILLARVDITLSEANGEATGRSMELKFIDDDKLWAVRPGGSKYSFQLIPLEKH